MRNRRSVRASLALTCAILGGGGSARSDDVDVAVEQPLHATVTCCAGDECAMGMSTDACIAWLHDREEAESETAPPVATSDAEAPPVAAAAGPVPASFEGDDLGLMRPLVSLMQSSIVIVGDCHPVEFPRGTHPRVMGILHDCLIDVVRRGAWAFAGERALVQGVVAGPRILRAPVDGEWLVVVPLADTVIDGRSVFPLAQPIGIGEAQ